VLERLHDIKHLLRGDILREFGERRVLGGRIGIDSGQKGFEMLSHPLIKDSTTACVCGDSPLRLTASQRHQPNPV
jgi:hypothetical protein